MRLLRSFPLAIISGMALGTMGFPRTLYGSIEVCYRSGMQGVERKKFRLEFWTARLSVGLSLLLWTKMAAGCAHDLNTAQGVAEEFLDQHYVKIDIPKARQYAVGL